MSIDFSRRKLLGEVLIENGLISRETLSKALERQRETRKQLGEVLLDLKLVDEKDLIQAISRQQGYPVMDLDRTPVEKGALKAIPEPIARRFQVMPLREESGTLVVATFNPTHPTMGNELALAARKPIRFVLATPSAIIRAIDIHYRAQVDLGRHLGGDEDSPLVKTVDLIIVQGVHLRASDIHIEPQEKELRIRYRVDGVLQEATPLPLDLATPVASRIKVMADLDIVEKHRPQDGQIQFKADNIALDIRVSVMNTVWGEKIVLRLLSREKALVKLEELGFSPQAYQIYRRLIAAPYGMILVAGPTGSGKTTTLYASINELDHVSQNIITLEDPVEYTFAGITQVAMNPKAGVEFASSLRAVLRQDPDVIVVGEIRDGETAEIAIHAALTGHLVLSSLHANDALATIFRLLDSGVEPFLLGAAISGAISQRLVRRICPNCQAVYQPGAGELELYRAYGPPGAKEVFYHGTGCNRCHGSGYSGRVAVVEVLAVSEEMRHLIARGASQGEIRERAEADGFVSLRWEGMAKVAADLTTVEEIIRSVWV